MKQKLLYKLLLFFVLFVICLFNSQTIGNSFSVQGTPSSIVRLKISKSIKDVRHNNIISSHQNQNKQMELVISESRHGLGGPLYKYNSCAQQNKINKYEQTTALCCKIKNIDKAICQNTTTRQVLRI
jgi:hypothetical protein